MAINNQLDSLPSLKEVIKNYDIAPKKSLGQNFLFDMNLINRIVRSVPNIEGADVLEIGPGPGGLTRSLLNNGAKTVTAIEKDDRCIEALNQIKAIYPDRLEIISADALEFQEEQLGFPVRIVANLPYNIATVLLFKWLDKIELFSSMTLMFQKEVADRIVATPGSKLYGRLSVMSQFSCNVSKVFEINPSAFVPAPKIFSAIVNFTPKQKNPDIDKEILSLICKVTFNQRRKFLSTSLKQLVKDPKIILEAANIAPTLRPEQLSLDDFCRLAKAYSS